MNYEEKYKKSLDRATNLFVTNNISATAVCEIFPELNESEKVNYEKKYKAALEWMQGLYSGLHGATKEDAEHYFPELKESEDERIRKAIIDYLKKHYEGSTIGYGVQVKEVIAWLEKQGGQTHAKLGQELSNIIEPKKINANKVIAWLVANIINYEYYVKRFKKDFGL